MLAFEKNDLLIGYTSYYVHLRPNGPGDWTVVETIDPYWIWYENPTTGDPTVLSDQRNTDFDRNGNVWINIHDGGFLHAIAQDGTELYSYLIGPRPPDYYDNPDVGGPSDPGGLLFGSWVPICGADGKVHWWNHSYNGFGSPQPRPYQYIEIDQDGILLAGPTLIGDKHIGGGVYIDDGSSGAWANYDRTELWQPEGLNIAGFPSWIARLDLATLTYTRANFTGGIPDNDAFCYRADTESFQTVCECADGRILIATIALSSPFNYHIYLHDSDGIRIKEYSGLTQASPPSAGRVASIRLDPLDEDYFLFVVAQSGTDTLAGFNLYRVNIETDTITTYALPGNNGAVRAEYGFNQFRAGRGPWSIGVAWGGSFPGQARLKSDGSQRWFRSEF